MLLTFSLMFLSNLKADTNTVSLNPGASIRTATEKSEQGLRFYANLLDDDVDEHGFYLIYGKATINDLTSALKNSSDELEINGKKVFKVEVEETEDDGSFSVVLTGIPEIGYKDSITAIAYTKKGNTENYSKEVINRSVLEVALRMEVLNESNSASDNILNYAKDNIKLVKNINGNIHITNDFYETDINILETLFLNDWNKTFETNLADTKSDFITNAKVGLEGGISANKNLSNSNVYKFFNNESNKIWKWMLDYIIEVDGGVVHPARQAEAIKGDGTNGDYLLYHADHFLYSVSNFFNKAHNTGFSTAINFTGQAKYETLNNYKILGETNYYNLDDTLTLKVTEEADLGFTFKHFTDGTNTYLENDELVINDNLIIEHVYEPIEYSIKYYDGDLLLEDLNDTYTILDEYVLKAGLEKEGYIFDGWYDNLDFDGKRIETIKEGTTGDKVFYAKYINEGDFLLDVTYELGEYGYHTFTKEELFSEFTNDFYNFYGSSGFSSGSASPENMVDNFLVHGQLKNGTIKDFLLNKDTTDKWGFLYDYIFDVSNKTNYSDENQLFGSSPNEAYWRYNVWAFWTQSHRDTWPVSIDFTSNELANNFWTYTSYNVLETTVTEDELLDASSIYTWNDSYVFDGWYESDDFTGDKVESLLEYSGSVTLYAKWIPYFGEHQITYNLGEYGHHTVTKAELFNEFINDYKSLFGRAASVAEFEKDFFGKSYLPETYNIVDIFKGEYKDKWGWLFDYFVEIGAFNQSETAQATIRAYIHHFFIEKSPSGQNTEAISNNPETLTNFWPYTKYHEIVEDFDIGYELLTEDKFMTWNEYYEFEGWYLNEDLSGDKVTKIDELEESITLYAKWKEMFIVEVSIDDNTLLRVDETLKINYEVFGTQKDLVFQTDDLTVLSVNDEGLIKALSVGNAIVQILIDDEVIMEFYVEVVDEEMDEVLEMFINNSRSVINTDKINYYGGEAISHTISESVFDYLFEDLDVVRNMLPESEPNHSNISMDPDWIVIHDTANVSKTAGAEANSNWVLNPSNDATSWHYTVGNDGWYQQLEEDTVGWHAGDGSARSGFTDTKIEATKDFAPLTITEDRYYAVDGIKTDIKAPDKGNIIKGGIWAVIIDGTYHIPNTRYSNKYGQDVVLNGGNYDGIGIEMAVNEGSDVWLTWAKTAKLVADILVRNDLYIDRVATHNHFDGKNCPQTAYESDNMENLYKMIEMEYLMRTKYKDYQVSFESHNKDILDNNGRVIKALDVDTTISYTLTVTDANNNTHSVTLSSVLKAK